MEKRYSGRRRRHLRWLWLLMIPVLAAAGYTLWRFGPQRSYTARQLGLTDLQSPNDADGDGVDDWTDVVLEAAKMLEKGCTADEIIRQAEENCGRMRQFFMVDDLKYLRRGGRISAAAQVAGSLLKIKPILQSDPEGHIIQHSKVRGQLKAMETLAELYKEYAVDGTRTVGIAHADCPDGALRLQAKLRDAGQTGEILSVCYEPVTGGHVGPGTVALFFFGEVWR